MFKQIKQIIIFSYSIRDIGAKRLSLRVYRYLSKKIQSHYLFIFRSNSIQKTLKAPCKWSNILIELREDNLKGKTYTEFKTTSISFNFLNDSKTFHLPMTWHNKNWPRLWQFNLHYFDWAREWLDHAIATGEWQSEAVNLEYLIDNWIDSNPIGFGDAWHSYTISLRTRNWIWLFRSYPRLVTLKRLNSLWIQLQWLQNNLEDYIDGNHYLENLITLAIGGLQFENFKAVKMYEQSIKKIEKQLTIQILPDGGYFERSAYYHNLMLNRLVELALVLESVKGFSPNWLINAIDKLFSWSTSLRLTNGNYPRFNDSPITTNKAIDNILELANSYLYSSIYKGLGLNQNLSKLLLNRENKQLSSQKSLFSQRIVDKPNTGWTLLRIGDGWEFIAKTGKSCPDFLPAHAHSDLFSFDLFHKGIPVLVEAGVSTYQNNIIRKYERSGAAHNIIQFRLIERNLIPIDLDWIESVQTWHSFQAGRKAIILKRNIKELSNGDFVLSLEHDACNKYGINHERTITIGMNDNKKLSLRIVDNIYSKHNIEWRQWFHLGPKQDKQLLDLLSNEFYRKKGFNLSWYETNFSEGFGNRLIRNSLLISGNIFTGKKTLKFEMNF